MKLLRKKQDETSATIAQTLWLVLACSGLFVLTSYAADPSWWFTPGPGSLSAVMTPQVTTNNGVVTTNYVANNYAVVTQGQLKQFTARAVDELNANLSGGAGPALSNLVNNWQQDYATHNYNSPTNAYAPYNPRDFTAMTVGQLKYIGNMVWSQLEAAGYTNAVPTWIAQNTNTDNALANIGQLKTVFNFDPLWAISTVMNLTATANTDGSVTLNWTLPSNGSGNTITIAGETPNGTWTTLDSVSGTTTSVTLSASQVSFYSSLTASNALINLLASLSIGAITNPAYTPPRFAVIDLGAGVTPQFLNKLGSVVYSTNSTSVFWKNGAPTTNQPTFTVVGLNDNDVVVGTISGGGSLSGAPPDTNSYVEYPSVWTNAPGGLIYNANYDPIFAPCGSYGHGPDFGTADDATVAGIDNSNNVYANYIQYRYDWEQTDEGYLMQFTCDYLFTGQGLISGSITPIGDYQSYSSSLTPPAFNAQTASPSGVVLGDIANTNSCLFTRASAYCVGTTIQPAGTNTLIPDTLFSVNSAGQILGVKSVDNSGNNWVASTYNMGTNSIPLPPFAGMWNASHQIVGTANYYYKNNASFVDYEHREQSN